MMSMVLSSSARSIAERGEGLPLGFSFEVALLIYASVVLLLPSSNSKTVCANLVFYFSFISIVGGILSGLTIDLVGHTGTYALAMLLMISSLFALRLIFPGDYQTTSSLAITVSRRQ
ncbi:MAG: hypothetical protein AAGA73_13725 [Pseudomonadota bacterium]